MPADDDYADYSDSSEFDDYLYENMLNDYDNKEKNENVGNELQDDANKSEDDGNKNVKIAQDEENFDKTKSFLFSDENDEEDWMSDEL